MTLTVTIPRTTRTKLLSFSCLNWRFSYDYFSIIYTTSLKDTHFNMSRQTSRLDAKKVVSVQYISDPVDDAVTIFRLISLLHS